MVPAAPARDQGDCDGTKVSIGGINLAARVLHHLFCDEEEGSINERSEQCRALVRAGFPPSSKIIFAI